MSSIRFTTPDGLSLEGEVREADGTPRGTAVLCHPHPRHGGSKDHPILWAIRNDLASRRGLTVLAFNFRGIMGSEGTYGGGEAELQDVDAAVNTVRGLAEGPTLLVGWSFGAWIALRHSVIDRRVRGLVLIGMPLDGQVAGSRPLPSLGELENLLVPVLLVAGDDDPFCSVESLRNLGGWIPNAETLIVPRTDHFFGRRERELAETIGTWVERTLPDQTSR
ncbi:MAG TPA: alpha/beta fold hydrolase [Actinomycetota bacterium]|nr:alpha/beta fold hydrolase [Actinomycetota bacterium]